MDIAKTAAWIRRALSGLFAVLMAFGSSLSGEPYIASGDAELTRSLLYSYAEGEGIAVCPAADGWFFIFWTPGNAACASAVMRFLKETLITATPHTPI